MSANRHNTVSGKRSSNSGLTNKLPSSARSRGCLSFDEDFIVPPAHVVPYEGWKNPNLMGNSLPTSVQSMCDATREQFRLAHTRKVIKRRRIAPFLPGGCLPTDSSGGASYSAPQYRPKCSDVGASRSILAPPSSSSAPPGRWLSSDRLFESRSLPDDSDPLCVDFSHSRKLQIWWGSAERQGVRPAMEDKHSVVIPFDKFDDREAKVSHSLSYFCVLDGHTGVSCADFLSRRLHHSIRSNVRSKLLAQPRSRPSLAEASKAFPNSIKDPADPTTHNYPIDFHQSLHEAFLATDTEYLTQFPNAVDGSTAIVCIMDFQQPMSTSFANNHYTSTAVHLANVGDCRAVLAYRGEASVSPGVRKTNSPLPEDIFPYRLSSDHKPFRLDERLRIESHGGLVRKLGCGRVGVPGCSQWLAVSRAMGDFGMKFAKKGVIITDPECTSRKLDPSSDEFIIIACDGVWDVVTDTEAVEAVAKSIRSQELQKGAAAYPSLILQSPEWMLGKKTQFSDETNEAISASTKSDLLVRATNDLLDLCLANPLCCDNLTAVVLRFRWI